MYRHIAEQCFNSKKVQLKAGTLPGSFLFADSFNSKKVQLKGKVETDEQLEENVSIPKRSN